MSILDTEPRVVCVPVADEMLAQWMTTDTVIHARCIDGLPEGARLVGLNRLEFFGYGPAWQFVFEHESFAPVAEGASIPVRVISYATEDLPDVNV